jgi:CheY-like chemotaxis protein
MLAAIFDMFTQVDHTLERAQSGLGVGLSLAKRLVELHGGTIEGQSDGPGCGSRFIVRLPLSGSALRANGARNAVAAPMPVAALRVLIADDNQDFAESLAVLLEAGGHAVRVTHDGNAAVAQAFALPPDVAFLDIGLPGRNGYDVAHTLRSAEATRGAMLVAITGWGQEKDRTLAREAGFDRHLVKPVAPEAITAILADVAARRSPEIVHDTQI